MIAYIDGKDLVFAQIKGDRQELRKRIDNSQFGDTVDKYIVKQYLSKGMLLCHKNYTNENMYCDPNDIIENVDKDTEYADYRRNLSKFSSRISILYFDVIPYIELKEIEKILYDENIIKKLFESYRESNDSYKKFIDSVKNNTEILNIVMDKRSVISTNFDDENIQNILDDNTMLDDNYTYRPMEVNKEKVKELKLSRENASIGAKILID